MQKVKFTILISIFVLFASCGYKIVDQSEINNFNIYEINTKGEKRINYFLKNKLLNIAKKNSSKEIAINIDTKKIKTTKERNIKNEITKYSILVTSKIDFSILSQTTIGSFTLKKRGEYSVADQYAQTLNNEKKITKQISQLLAEEILKELDKRLNDI